jgi:hypothetical protein
MAGIHGETSYESVEKAYLNKKRTSSSFRIGRAELEEPLHACPNVRGDFVSVSYPKGKVLTDVPSLMRKTFTRFGTSVRTSVPVASLFYYCVSLIATGVAPWRNFYAIMCNYTTN